MGRKETPDILSELFNAKPQSTLAPQPTQLPIGSIRRDGATQMRAQLNTATITEYAADMANDWGNFPPVIVYYDGSDYWLADGFHRIEAYMALGGTRAMHTIPAEIRTGTRRDAILHAASANSSHGLRRTNADKQRAVDTLLRDQEWANWSDSQIAKACNVDHKTVSAARIRLAKADMSLGNSQVSDDEVKASLSAERTYTTKHGTTATMQTGDIGAKRGRPSAAKSDERPLESAVPSAKLPVAPPAADIPAAIMAGGWEMRELGELFYMKNSLHHRATGVHKNRQGAIDEAQRMQSALDAAAAPEALDDVETIDKMWNCRTAQGVLRNMVDYWSTVKRIQIHVEMVDREQGTMEVKLIMQMPDLGWKQWTGATLEEVVRKADLSL